MFKLLPRVSALAGLEALATATLGVSAQEAPQSIRIGWSLAKSGVNAGGSDTTVRPNYEMWVKEVNAAGGIFLKAFNKRVPVTVVEYEDRSSTEEAVRAIERLITQDKVNFLFAPFGSGAAKAASTVSEQYGVPTIAATASSAQVYDQGYKYLFGTFTPNDTLTNPLSDLVAKKAAGVKRVAILARNDLFPLAIAQEMEKSAKDRGLSVVFFEKYAINTLDHSAALAQIKQINPHWIFATGYINDLVLIKKQMADQRIEAPVVTMVAGPAYKEFVDALGKSAENISSAAWWHPAAGYRGIDIFCLAANQHKPLQAK